MDYHFLLDLAIILLFTKIFGVFSKHYKLPQVVGAIVAGLILGPVGLNIIHESDFIKKLSEVGVIVLMFTAGMEVNINELKKSGRASFVIALLGVFIPLGLGFLVASIFNGGLSGIDTKTLLQNIFIGVILTATSVSITVETLREMGKLKTKSGTAILSAALIDDVLGIIILTIVTSSSNSSVSIPIVLIKIVSFFVLCLAIGYPFYYIFEKYTNSQKERRRFVIIAFAFCLILSYVAEHFFGVADITGAFIAGVVLSGTKQSAFINRRFEILSYILISPLFFANIGISIPNLEINSTILYFGLAIIFISIIAKIGGCFLGALISKFSAKESLRIGVGMVARGEVALIIANKGLRMGLMKEEFFGAIILMVICTAILTPILLKILYKNNKKEIHCV